MNNRSKSRTVNGVVSAVITCFFFVHAVLGSLSAFVALPAPATWVLWVGMALVGVHVVVCVATSYEQLTDTVRPPSNAKKRHLLLKWATGIALVCVACFHIVRVRELSLASALHSPIGTGVVVVLAVALAVHVWTGSKSLLKDLGADRRYRNVVRACACVLAAGCVLAAWASMAA